MQSVAPYEEALDTILGGEVDATVRDLSHAIDALVYDGDAAPLAALEDRVLAILEATRAIDPPRELRRLHLRLDTLHVSIALGARVVRNGGASSRAPVLSSCLSDLIGYYEQLLTDLLEQGCQSGDTLALENQILPRLRAELAALETSTSKR